MTASTTTTAIVLDPLIVALAGRPPANVNLADTTTRRNDAIVAVVAAMAFVAMAGRIWARNIKAARLWVDDWLVFIAMFMVLGTTAFTIAGGCYKVGYHIWVMTVTDIVMINRILFGYTFIYAAAVACNKLSFIFYYVRVFHAGHASSVLCCRDLLSVTLVFAGFLALCYPLMVWISLLSICSPVHFFWDQYSEGAVAGKCGNTMLFYIAAGITNMIIDILILLIPIPLILKLQVRTSDKFMLAGIFMLGGFVCIASIIRLHYLLVFQSSVDLTWVMGDVFIWSSVEPSLGIISSCLISLRPVFVRMWSEVFGARCLVKPGQEGKSGAGGGGCMVRSRGDFGGSGSDIWEVGGVREARRASNDEGGGYDVSDDELALVTIHASGGVSRDDVMPPKDGVIQVVRETSIRHARPYLGDRGRDKDFGRRHSIALSSQGTLRLESKVDDMGQ